MILRSNAPYIHTDLNTPYIYTNMMAAVLPCALYSVFCYGIRAAVTMAACAMLSLVAARICDRLRGVAAAEYYDISAMVSGIIYALLLPPGTPLIISILGILIGELAFKQLFGGLGGNPVNMAAASALFINLLFEDIENGYIEPYKDRLGLDGLFTLHVSGDQPAVLDDLYITEILTGSYAGRFGTGCCLMILIGIVYLVSKRIVRIEAPVAYLVTVLIGYCILYKVDVLKSDGQRELLVFMVTSGVLFAAAFMITDYICVSQGLSGGIISGCFAGLMTVVLSRFTSNIVYLTVPVIMTNYLTYTLECVISSVRSRRKLRV